MQSGTRHDIFEPGDRTALVCIDDREIYSTLVEQLVALGYKIHSGLFAEDIALKMKSQTYDVVILYEYFCEADLETNTVLQELARVPASQRRQQFVALIGGSMITDSEMHAFKLSVDLTVGLSDIKNFSAIFLRALARHQQFYRPYKECAAMAGLM